MCLAQLDASRQSHTRTLIVLGNGAPQADKRFADAKREAAVDTKAAYQQEWKTKVIVPVRSPLQEDGGVGSVHI